MRKTSQLILSPSRTRFTALACSPHLRARSSRALRANCHPIHDVTVGAAALARTKTGGTK